MKKVIIILSGGMDSTTLLYALINNPFYKVVGALTFDYGQKHKKEIECAKKIAENLNIEHQVVNLKNLKKLLVSSLTDKEQKVPEGNYMEENMKSTVVPNRNAIMLMIAVGWAITKNADWVAYAAHSGDHFIYPDCRPLFVSTINKVTEIANFKPVKIIAPYLGLTKAQILAKGIKLGVPYKDTWTCYRGSKKACGECGACRERLSAFEENNSFDQLEYE